MNLFNYAILTIGVTLISAFWNVIGPKERKKETLIITVILSILSILVYFLQSKLWPNI